MADIRCAGDPGALEARVSAIATHQAPVLIWLLEHRRSKAILRTSANFLVAVKNSQALDWEAETDALRQLNLPEVVYAEGGGGIRASRICFAPGSIRSST
jgi:hypothetical protein